ncbi:MAG: nucleotidyltransferase [Muribaculaceae bacterium]|nr:nucleotidyltransferase [Muribaculaceae bacterium]
MKPTLLVLAAGMGSRYGGLKQLDGVGPHGETIMDYSIYDAMQAGFGKVVFVIRRDFEESFREKVLSKYEGAIPVEVVFQDITALPEGYSAPAGRTKPWGTNHAIMMGAPVVTENFAVINADDFYSRDAFKTIAAELSRERKPGEYCMVGFRVGNTMTENGSVSRGVCTTDADGKLVDVTERTSIAFDDKHDIFFTEADGTRGQLDPAAPVSMNLWGFTPEYFSHSERLFRDFLDAHITEPKSEFYIPSVVDTLVKGGQATVDVLDTDAQWFGVTYPEDRQSVVDRLAELHAEGVYPDKLF